MFYKEEYLKMRKVLDSPFLEHLSSVQEQLICAISALDKEFNTNGGVNWEEEAYSEYLEILEDTLIGKENFSKEELENIGWAINEIRECGRELEHNGESAKNAERAIYYLRDRTIDWNLAHKDPISTGLDDEYIGHY